MGWHTYLRIERRILSDWRKFAPNEGKFIFRKTDLRIIYQKKKSDLEHIRITYSTTANKAIMHLNEQGFTWEACVQIEERVRSAGGAAESLMLGREIGKSIMRRRSKSAAPSKKSKIADGNKLGRMRTAFANIPGSRDLEDFANYLWTDFSRHYSSGNEKGWNCWGAFLDPYSSVEEEPGLLRVFEKTTPQGARAFESLAWLRMSSPLLCWPLVMRIGLSAVPPGAAIELDLSTDMHEHIGGGLANTPEEYAEKYYDRAQNSVSTEAELVGRYLSILAPTPGSPSRDYWRGRAKAALSSISEHAKSPKDRGDRLEDLICAIFGMCKPDLEIVERNLRRHDEELDVVISNHVRDSFWSSLQSPLLFVECKNWSSPVGAGELRIFAEKIRERRSLCRVGFLIAPGGFTRSIEGMLRSRQAEGVIIFLLTFSDLEELAEGNLSFAEWVPKKGIGKLLKMS